MPSENTTRNRPPAGLCRGHALKEGGVDKEPLRLGAIGECVGPEGNNKA